MMEYARTITLDCRLDDLTDLDHSFDAFLCALTAWAHHYRQTMTWDMAGVPAEYVDVEGHILVLS